jgi:hypothetical protein
VGYVTLFTGVQRPGEARYRTSHVMARDDFEGAHWTGVRGIRLSCISAPSSPGRAWIMRGVRDSARLSGSGH